jgi:hypothetical protein
VSVPIHPGSRVGELLEAYPGIEETLIRLAPAFGKLRNPILRKTVAKVATLEQAARVGGISVRDLVRALREATGQPGDFVEANPNVLSTEPLWPDSAAVRETLNADELLESGVHPLGMVRAAIARLSPGEAVLLLSGFHPAPLIEALADSGRMVYSRPHEGRHETLIVRGPKV